MNSLTGWHLNVSKTDTTVDRVPHRIQKYTHLPIGLRQGDEADNKSDTLSYHTPAGNLWQQQQQQQW